MDNQASHTWVDRNYGYLVCSKCGIVKRRDGLNSPCKGIVRVTLRGQGEEND